MLLQGLPQHPEEVEADLCLCTTRGHRNQHILWYDGDHIDQGGGAQHVTQSVVCQEAPPRPVDCKHAGQGELKVGQTLQDMCCTTAACMRGDHNVCDGWLLLDLLPPETLPQKVCMCLRRKTPRSSQTTPRPAAPTQSPSLHTHRELRAVSACCCISSSCHVPTLATAAFLPVISTACAMRCWSLAWPALLQKRGRTATAADAGELVHRMLRVCLAGIAHVSSHLLVAM